MAKLNADLMFKNGAIYTVDRRNKWVQSMVISGSKISFVGSNADAEKLIDADTEVVDLGGKLVLPGFIDAHSHPSHAMDYFGNISLYELTSLDEYRQEIVRFVKNNADRNVFRGRGWSDKLFPKTGPSKSILDELIPDRPVALVSYDGHSLWVNSYALERAQVTVDTPDPDGGVIERELESGEPSGTLRETAMNLITRVLPDYSLDERVNTLLAYQEMALGAGVTMTHDAMLNGKSIAAYQQLQADGNLGMRFRGSITIQPDLPVSEQIAAVLDQRAVNLHSRFQTNTAKIFVDGVIEGGTGFLLEPYEHKPDFLGVPIWSTDLLNEVVAALDKENIQVHMHVIGDAAARIALDAFEIAQQANGRRDSRHLMTHLQLVAPEDIQRFNQLGVVGVPNPYWFKVDDYYHTLALPYLGKTRADRQYPLKSFFEADVVMASASDFPVTIPFDPLIGIQLGITRAELGGSSAEVLWPEEKASLDQMIASFTYHGAYANFLEEDIGSLEAGKEADFIILDRNLFELPEAEIADTRVLHTYVAGQEAFRAVHSTN